VHSTGINGQQPNVGDRALLLPCLAGRGCWLAGVPVSKVDVFLCNV
jgi:hypothetical protein